MGGGTKYSRVIEWGPETRRRDNFGDSGNEVQHSAPDLKVECLLDDGVGRVDGKMGSCGLAFEVFVNGA